MCEAPSLPEREGGGFAVPAFADSLSLPPPKFDERRDSPDNGRVAQE